MNNTEKVCELLVAYGEAVRADWSTLDGREVQKAMQRFAQLLSSGEDVDTPAELDALGVGKGEWGYEWQWNL